MDGFARYSSLPLRLVLGIGFVYHGYPKLFTSSGREMFVGMLNQIGVPLSGLMSWIVAVVEFFGGLALIVGALLPVVALLGIINMLVAMFAVHLPHGFNFMNITGMTDQGPQFGMPGYEVNLLYIAGFAALLLGGSGRLSVDHRMKKKWQEEGSPDLTTGKTPREQELSVR